MHNHCVTDEMVRFFIVSCHGSCSCSATATSHTRPARGRLSESEGPLVTRTPRGALDSYAGSPCPKRKQPLQHTLHWSWQEGSSRPIARSAAVTHQATTATAMHAPAGAVRPCSHPAMQPSSHPAIQSLSVTPDALRAARLRILVLKLPGCGC